MRAQPSKVLAVEHVSVGFVASRKGRSVRVVEDVTFGVERGQTLALLGESGCGKTVTALAIARLLPVSACIERGRVVIDHLDVLAASPQQLREVRGRRIALIAQDPTGALNPVFTIGYQLTAAIRLHFKCSKAQATHRASALLDQVRLPEPARILNAYPHQLSGGMQQRVAIALALAGDPVMLVADEPTSALDVVVQGEIIALLRDLQHERQLAMLLITHDFAVVRNLASRIAVMYAGSIVEQGTTDDVLTRPSHPYTRALVQAVPSMSTANGARRLVEIPGQVPAPGMWPDGCRFAPRCALVLDVCRRHPPPPVQISPTQVSWCHAVKE